jgi:hypothetical protein
MFTKGLRRDSHSISMAIRFRLRSRDACKVFGVSRIVLSLGAPF